MTRFESPAFQDPGGHLPPAAVRGLLGAAALALTAAVWVGVGTQAGHFGDRDTSVRVTLPAVVIAGRRLPPGEDTAALGAGPAGVGCVKDAFPHDGASLNRVNLNQ